MTFVVEVFDFFCWLNDDNGTAVGNGIDDVFEASLSLFLNSSSCDVNKI